MQAAKLLLHVDLLLPLRSSINGVLSAPYECIKSVTIDTVKNHLSDWRAFGTSNTPANQTSDFFVVGLGFATYLAFNNMDTVDYHMSDWLYTRAFGTSNTPANQTCDSPLYPCY